MRNKFSTGQKLDSRNQKGLAKIGEPLISLARLEEFEWPSVPFPVCNLIFCLAPLACGGMMFPMQISKCKNRILVVGDVYFGLSTGQR